jgi:hypothetical protein
VGRLAHRIFTTDCMNTLFFKSPPQITIAEMCGDLPTADEFFEALDAASFSRLVATTADIEPQTRSLKDLVTLFLGDEWPGPNSPHLIGVRTEHLMCLMFGKSVASCFQIPAPAKSPPAFHSIIFVSRTGLLLSSIQGVLRGALSQWKELWHIVNSGNTAERSLVGFAKYALELWWLAQKILEVSQSGDERSPYMTSTPTDSLKELHDFISRHQTPS